MISKYKEYKTRNGKKVRIICYDRKASSFPIVALVGDNENQINLYTKDGTYCQYGIRHDEDLIDITYDNWQVDDKIEVSDNGIDWHRRYFAGLTKDGKPKTWMYGMTSWTCGEGKLFHTWNYARKPFEINHDNHSL